VKQSEAPNYPDLADVKGQQERAAPWKWRRRAAIPC
jgi:hypothetical protein